ncbi:hypothetical protein KTR66_16190 [Roseococcus sp. SDR]|uniref:hypothetical protein n=1 Tax=Roseococcus sp. SDR TaxID=2835532 RepID=UPI001BCAEF16|nr:hypothetical protein [Roseococcus sp. SDR]MBS7791543.1 hypothetical protein [Roseococcus sp. SDR]MBV1846857.1 hypothetical protein [Roseococcus sp. SDR]
MRSALPLLIAGGSLALLPLLAPAATVLPGARERGSPCLFQQESAVSVSRDWMGSLQGWHDSALVQAWRTSLARAKGKVPAGACQSGDAAGS